MPWSLKWASKAETDVSVRHRLVQQALLQQALLQQLLLRVCRLQNRHSVCPGTPNAVQNRFRSRTSS